MECLHCYEFSLFSNQIIVTAGYNIDENYEPYISADELQDAQAQLQQPESVEQYYTRNFLVTRCILQATEAGKKMSGGGGRIYKMSNNNML